MADREKDFSSAHNGTFNPNYPTRLNGSNESHNTSTLDPKYSHESPYDMPDNINSDQALRRIRTAGSISISPELFEKIYLSPQNSVKGDLRKTFGNPTPLALLGFLLSLSPLACDLMGWRGAGGDGAAGTGTYVYIGGLLMFTGGLLEFFLGNTFPFVVFCSFGGFWFSFAATLTPWYNAYGAYSPDPNNPSLGITNPSFQASFGFFCLFMGMLCLVYFICALRTNIVFLVIFACLFFVFCLLAGVYWTLALGKDWDATAGRLQVAAGAFSFICVMAGWWIFLAQMLACVDFPIQLPVGDISHLIKGASVRMAEKEQYSV
ncbi:hypothetical protein MMC12_002131 [Toensbergia leucococca]|nr:hypothetical protein [Toensbergia leucococca]